jgi:hypothetical protein
MEPELLEAGSESPTGPTYLDSARASQPVKESCW